MDPETVGADYINANYISGEVPGSENRYIATQVSVCSDSKMMSFDATCIGVSPGNCR